MNTAEIPVLKLHRTFAASRERVFAAWTDPALIKQWFGPEGCSISEIQVDFRIGGQYRFAVTSDKHGDMAVGGTYREIAPPSKLVYTWAWEEDEAFANHDTVVTVEFIEQGQATEVRLTHEHLPNSESGQNHEYGWNGALDKLAKLFNS